MNHYIKKLAPLAFVTAILFASCSDAKKGTEEKTEISAMDSTSKAVKESMDKLDNQTKKVEESLEKLDKEFETTK
jgi:septal ring factor EnvC (AmiA/AmiB activator)